MHLHSCWNNKLIFDHWLIYYQASQLKNLAAILNPCWIATNDYFLETSTEYIRSVKVAEKE